MEKKTGPVRVISSTRQLGRTFRYWAEKIYDIIGVDEEKRKKALMQIDQLQSFRWNVVEIYPQVFFDLVDFFNREVQVFCAVGGGYLRSNPCCPLGNHRI